MDGRRAMTLRRAWHQAGCCLRAPCRTVPTDARSSRDPIFAMGPRAASRVIPSYRLLVAAGSV